MKIKMVLSSSFSAKISLGERKEITNPFEWSYYSWWQMNAVRTYFENLFQGLNSGWFELLHIF